LKLFAILSWFEEPPSWLAATVASLHGLCDHVVAVDGAYELFPGSGRKPVSGPEQAETILATATALGMGCTIVRPQRAWAGNEVGKRDAAFKVANALAEPGRDWLLIMDADEVATSTAHDITRAELEQTDLDVATAVSWTRHIEQPLPGEQGVTYPAQIEGYQPFRKFFRADPTLRVTGAHYIYLVGHGRKTRALWGHSRFHTLAEAAETQLRVEHRTEYRGQGRRRLQTTYYEVRDKLAVENPEAAA
jgi:hypothetical protein